MKAGIGFVVLFVFFQKCFGSKILFLVPLPSKSHLLLSSELIRELVNRGHEVTVVAPFEFPDPPKGLSTILLPNNIQDFVKLGGNDKDGRFALRNVNKLKSFLLGLAANKVVEAAMVSKPMQDFMKSNQKFDLVIGQGFLTEALFGGFSHKFNAPLIGFFNFIPNIWANEMVGNPAPAAYVPEPVFPFSHKMSFTERCMNSFAGILGQFIYYNIHLRSQNQLMKKYFGTDFPHLKEILRNTSLELVNHHFSLAFPRPYLPNMIEIGGIHVKAPKPLPKDLKEFMDGATDGVILFSMGSNLLSSDFPEEKIQGILNGFSRLKQRVLWKLEKENVSNLPKNVKIIKWLPQNDVLAHPKMKLFITHGGLLSFMESVARGVPVVAIPIFVDQPINVRFIEELELGVGLQYDDINEKNMVAAIQKVLSDPKYVINVKYRSSLMKDMPMTQINTAIYWIEYVIRHKGAPHLRSAAQNLTWYQVYLLDVFAFFVTVLGVFMFIFYKLFKCMLSMCCKKNVKVSQSKKKE